MKALRYVGKNGCRDKRYRGALAEPPDDLVILDLTSKRPNITLRATIDEQPLHLRTSPGVRDFRDIAVMSYILDTLAPRKDDRPLLDALRQEEAIGGPGEERPGRHQVRIGPDVRAGG